MRKIWKFNALLQNDKWLQPAFVTVDENGIIENISDKTSLESNNIESVAGIVLPGYQNAHSHAFQYAMAGIAEHLPLGARSDDFWSWREAMYELALNVEPGQLKAIASMLYKEMLRHGYTSVAEFHYLHHDKNGNRYSNLAEMGAQLIAAASEVGIKITLIPIFYQMGGFGIAANERQRRFISHTRDDYQKLLEGTNEIVKSYKNAHLGIGIHSLRAVCAEDIIETFHTAPSNVPRHIHVSEQQQEINASLAYLKKRPVEWLLDNINLNDTYHLVHATHIEKNEVVGIAKSKANVVLCPSTEGNLGDGLFPLFDFWKEGGRWCIGTDSHIGISPSEELRILDYGQRLKWEKRNILCRREGEDSGEVAFKESICTGRKAMGINHQNFFEVGQPFDAVVMDANYPLLKTTSSKRYLATIVYSCDSQAVLGTIVNGSWVIKKQLHEKDENISKAFAQAIIDLGNR